MWTMIRLGNKLCTLWLLSRNITATAFGSPINKRGPTQSCSTVGVSMLATIPRGGDRATALFLSPAIHSVLAGSIAGAIGVGVAFPLDTLKTKAQVIGQQASKNHSDTASMNMIQITKLIYETDGIRGFFGGVRGMMAGQAIIKAAAFGANAFMFQTLNDMHLFWANPIIPLILAAFYAGFLTSFLVTPMERIKVMMQASDLYTNELDCANAVLTKEGIRGLLGRGLGPTMAREVPSYGIYFVVYGLLSQTAMAVWLGHAAPLVNGALSGMASWIPVYPIDVVKTLVQNTEGGSTVSSWSVAAQLYRQGGVSAFFDGLFPKMLRAALNHSVTFYMYDIILKSLSTN